jgi:hypothetical protein
MSVIDIECDIPTKEVYQAILDDLRQGRIDPGMANTSTSSGRDGPPR